MRFCQFNFTINGIAVSPLFGYIGSHRARHENLFFRVKAVMSEPSKLTEFGFSQYEATCYLALLAHHPSNGSQLSRQSGIARSRIYDVLRNLARKDLAFEVETGRYVPLPPEELIKRLRRQFETNLPLGPELLVIAICVFPAIFEEIAFRGLVQERMVAAAGTLIGFVAASALFVALHFNILSAPYLFLLSMFLCWVRAATASLHPCMVLHFLHNYAVLFLLHGDGQ